MVEVGFAQDQLSCKVHYSGPMVATTVVEGFEEGRRHLQVFCVHADVNQFTASDMGVGLLAFPLLMERFNHVQGFHNPFAERPIQNVLIGIPEDFNPFPLPAPCEQYCQEICLEHPARVGF